MFHIISEIEINSPATCLKSCAEYSPGFTIYPDSSLLKFLDEMIDFLFKHKCGILCLQEITNEDQFNYIKHSQINSPI